MRVFAALLAAAVALQGPRAFAQYESADEILRRGVEQRRHGDDAAAVRSFYLAYEMIHSGNALAQLGLAEQAVGNWEAAEADLRGALETGDPWVERNRAALESAYSVVLQHVPGARRIVPSHPPQLSRPALVGAIGFGVGGAALVAGMIAWIVRESTIVSYNDRCRGLGDPTPPAGCEESAAVATASATEALAIAGGIGGVVIIGASALLFGIGRREHPRSTVLSCSAGPGELGVACALQF